MNGMQNSPEYDACGSYSNNLNVRFHDTVGNSRSLVAGSSVTRLSDENVCIHSQSFCFPSTLFDFASKRHETEPADVGISRRQPDTLLSLGSSYAGQNWSTDYGVFELSNGRAISCSLYSVEVSPELSSVEAGSANLNELSSCRGPLLNQRSTHFRLNKKSEMVRADADVSSSVNVAISPPVLDWGQKFLFSPSVVCLMVSNTCNDSILHVYEPYSTNIQFYPCNFTELLLGPGEVASICFVFLPRWLGLSSAHLVLQTSFGGFLVQAKGFAVESPYEIQSSTSMNVPSGWLSKHLSLSNSLDETIYVEEVTAWVSVSLGNMFHLTEAICIPDSFLESDEVRSLSMKDWLVVKSGQVGLPLMAMRPHINWDIDPRSRETIMEMDFPLDSEGKILGAFCMQLLGSSQDQPELVMVPFEIDLEKKEKFGGFSGPVTVYLDFFETFYFGGAIITISLKNSASRMLTIVKISEIAERKRFHIKYTEGLLLFPGTLTQVALISCAQLPNELHDSPFESSDIERNCMLRILTNDSSSPQIEIPCQDVFLLCSRNQKDSSIGDKHQSQNIKSGNPITGSLGSGMSSQFKAFETEEADEMVLRNWKSLGTTNGMSVLDDQELLFPMVQIGTHSSKWITVRNPSGQPVVMQLILNSGEIIEECRDMQAPSGSLVYMEPAAPKSYGFSVAESAVTEAYVQPYGEASLGPVFFSPSNPCGWRSSVLIRNNLSGVEWLPLRGFGGSHSLVLFDGSEPVQSIGFNLSMSIPLNISPLDMFFHTEETAFACSQRLSKEIHAKNVGDLPIEVRSIKVSGAKCGLDGFMVHSCKGFSLKPGESTKLLISYQTDSLAAMVHRDLELALASGILIIPMKASLPFYVLNICKKTVFWMRLKKFSVAILLVASLIFLVVCCIFPQVTAMGSQDCFDKEKISICTISNSGKSFHLPCNQKNSKFSVSAEIGCLLRSIGGGKSSKHASGNGYPDNENVAPEPQLASPLAVRPLENQRGINSLPDTQTGNSLSSFSKCATVNDSGATEASQPANLTVRIGKEKGRRRRKRKGAVTGLTALFDLSSSQSGNSTPSSPLSPVMYMTTNSTWPPSPDANQSVEARNPFARVSDRPLKEVQVSLSDSGAHMVEHNVPGKHCSNTNHFYTQEQSSAPGRSASKLVLLPPPSFPCASRPVPRIQCTSPLASTSTVAPHARAPGSNLFKQKAVQTEEKARVGNEYVYDIWGDHLSGLHLTGGLKDVTSLNSKFPESNSDSFFLKGPQTFMAKTQPRYVSFFHQEG